LAVCAGEPKRHLAESINHNWIQYQAFRGWARVTHKINRYVIFAALRVDGGARPLHQVPTVLMMRGMGDDGGGV
jgi:hypothetical protein